MDDRTGSTEDFEELACLVKASFPDLRCLRCGKDDFYLYGSDEAGDDRTDAVVTLVCTRCGHIEKHLAGPLRKAQKPIPRD